MKTYRADLHIHTVLSPCADEEMTPPRIVRRAAETGLDMIAVCDHNSSGNVRATQQAAEGRLAVLAGMEITTAEEVHVVALFPHAEAADEASAEVRAGLPRLRRRGSCDRQSLTDAAGAETGREPKMLSAASGLGLEQAVAMVHRLGGLAVAAHVDRPSFSVFSQLGVFPAQAGFDAIEVHGYPSRTYERAAWEGLGLPILHSSDSHYLDDIGSRVSELPLSQATFEELRLFLHGRQPGRAPGSA